MNTVRGSQTVNEDGSLTFSSSNSNPLAITDVDAGSNAVQVELGVSHGTLTLAMNSGLTFSSGANGQSTMTIQGTVNAINAGLAGLAYTPTPDFNGSDQLSIETNDLRNTPSSTTSTYTTIDYPNASSTFALGIDGNNIVGSYDEENGVSHGFKYDGYTTLDYPNGQQDLRQRHRR